MKLFIAFVFFSTSLISNITLEELDYIRSILEKDSKSIIKNGTDFCNDYFKKNSLFKLKENEFKNIFLCKFSKKRNRFYIYMLSIQKKEGKSLRKLCTDILNSWPEISDHMKSNFYYQNKEYLEGFYVENFNFNKMLSFSNNHKKDQQLMKNEINNFIINGNKFADDNQLNNKTLMKELIKLKKIYRKIISRNSSDLDILTKQSLYPIVRYKIFVNDLKKLQSYSCNWFPGNGAKPYVKIEKYNEFENF
jgi:hypothetical protein